MKTQIRNFISHFGLISLVLVAAIFWTTGCGMWLMGGDPTASSHQPPDPLAGWTFRGFDDFLPSHQRHHYQLDKAITDDYQDFIAKNKLDTLSAITGFYEDGTGQHAIEFEAFNSGNTSWQYALIYDKEDKRIKVIRYNQRRYHS
jgi:hypothetical protein